MSSLLNIEKLDDTNYDSWSVQMENVLIYQELWTVVSGATPKPEPGDNNENSAAVSAWLAKEQKARATIILSITPIQIHHVRNSKTSAEVWKTLRDIHKPKGAARKITLYKSLFNLRMGESESMQSYLCKFFSIVDKLADAGVDIGNEALIIALLASLPQSYDNLVVALESRDELPQLSAVKTKLIEEDERRRSQDTEPDEPENGVQAFFARDGKTNKYNNKTKSSDNAVNNSHRKQFKCYSCGRKGHYAANCRDKKRESNDKQNKGNSKNGLFALLNTSMLRHTDWCLDSGASSHLSCDRNSFSEFEEYSETIMLAGDGKMEAKGRGTVHLKTGSFDITLTDVLFVPGLQCSFMSVGKAVDHGYSVTFNNKTATITNKHGGIILRVNKVSDLFLLRTENNKLFYARENHDDALKWHVRYGHLNFASLRELSNKQLVQGMNVKIPLDINCQTCMESKCIQKPFGTSTSRAKELLEIIHSDVCGPMKHASIGGAKYMVTFIDDKSRYVFVYFIKQKSEVIEKFKEFKTMVERQTDRKIKVLRTDNGTEFVNNAFDEYLRVHGIIRQLTVPHTPQQNGTAERFNRTLIEMARTMIIGSKMKEWMWAEAVHTAAYLRNRSPTRALVDTTPYEVWHGHKPSVAHIKAFGSKAIALDKRQHGKFKARGKEYTLVGYADNAKAYRLYNPNTKQLIVSRDVYFLETTTTTKQHVSHDMQILPTEEPNEELNIRELNIREENPKQKQPSKEEEFISAEEDNEDAEEDEAKENVDNEIVCRGPGRPKIVRTGEPGRPRKQYNIVSMILSQVPTTVKEALSSDHSEEWRKAMKDEYEALIKNNTWELAELPDGQKVVGNRWVFALKKDKEGRVERFKARLVAKGYSQVYGVNYTETYSPVARYDTVRMIFAMAAEYELFVHQMDVSTAYLNSELNDTIYMAQPENFVDKAFPHRVLKLKKALYGLKQSGRQWNIKLDTILRQIGFNPCKSEPCVYIMHHDDKINVITVYVDDLLIACSDKQEMLCIKSQIAEAVDVVDKGPVQKFLSFEVDRDGETGGFKICQKGHIKKLLADYNMENCRPTWTPLDPGHQVKCQEDCDRVDPTQYQSLIGSLMYLAVCTRPDILHSVCKLSQQNCDPHIEHFNAAKRVLRYLCNTINKQLHYRKTGKDIECFADADWGGDSSDRKSYTGYVFFLGGAVFSYESKKQSTVALSTTEAEYMALSLAAKEAIYLKKLLNEMKLPLSKSITLNGDNMSALNLIKNPVYHSRSKHIDIKYHHIRDAYESGEIKLNYCSTTNMVADVLTKNLPRPTHERMTGLISLI